MVVNDAASLRRRVTALAENRPGVYRMINSVGRVIYVGQSKSIRNRLLSYFRATDHREKAARIMQATHDLEWQYTPSEFASRLRELTLIREHRPPYNVRMNRARNVAFIKLAGSPAPKLYVGRTHSTADLKVYGPVRSPARVREGVRVLNDLLGLRDCALDMPMTYSEQTDLFAPSQRAGCIRYELSTCLGPCAGFVSEQDYDARIAEAVGFLESRTVDPLNRVIKIMDRQSKVREFETARRWRDKFEALEWLFAEVNRARATLDALTFVYIDPGTFGDDRAYMIRHAEVVATAAAPHTPIEREAFTALLSEHTAPRAAPSSLDPDKIDEKLLVLSWFKRHPSALRSTYSFSHWLDA